MSVAKIPIRSDVYQTLFLLECLTFKVAQNSFLFFLTLTELGAIFQAWKCSVLNGCSIFLKITLHCSFRGV